MAHNYDSSDSHQTQPKNSPHHPFIASHKKIPEFTPLAVILGALLGILFGASSLYLALKVGMTVSASIPVAVLSITIFRAFSKIFGFRQATILENNIVQTTGSAGESIAFGIAVTMPAMLMLGYDMELGRTLLVSVLGGLLGVLMMIPLRYALIVKEHGHLAYPEGTACAEVLIVGETGGTSAKTVFLGFFTGLFYKLANVGLKLWSDTAEKALTWFKGATVACEVSPELLGVGYIIGPQIASIMVAGGILSSLVLIPAIKLFGDGLPTPLFPATKLISEMSPHEIWRNYVLYIGAGAVAAGGIISLFQSLPTIIRSALAGLQSFKNTVPAAQKASELKPRTDQDLSLKWVVIGSAALVVLIWATPSLKMNLVGSLLILAFGFLFTTVSSRLTGSIGSSSNPISGMTVATLLLTSLIFLLLGWVEADYRVTALSVAAIVCVASSVGGTTSQDLKTGFLVGATPKLQQIALLIGTFSSALVIGFILNVLNDASTIYTKKQLPDVQLSSAEVQSLTRKERVQGVDGKHDNHEYHILQFATPYTEGALAQVPPGKYLVSDDGRIQYKVDPGINGALQTRDDGSPVQKYEAPKARLMSLIIDGILTQKLPWGLVLLGVFISVLMELCGVSALPFAVGVYLPLASSSPIFVGGIIRWLVDRRKKAVSSETDSDSSPGVLLSSGLIAGGSIAGIGLALLSLSEGVGSALDFSHRFPGFTSSHWTPIFFFGALCLLLFKVGRHREKNQ